MFENYKFRPHSIVNIMGGVPKPLTPRQQATHDSLLERYNNPEAKPLTVTQLGTLGSLIEKKNAKCTLTDGAKKYLEQLVYEHLTKRSSKIKAKYLDKGIQKEDKSFTTYSNVIDKLLIKNKVRKQNDFFNGECDNAQSKIRDMKTSWSYESFPLTDTAIKNKAYEWQLDCYMDLWELKEAELVYVLVDTPTRLLNDELKRLDWKHNVYDQEGNIKDDIGRDLVVETVCNHIFTEKGLEAFCQESSLQVQLDWFKGVFVEIPEEMRVKVFHHAYCSVRNSQLKEMVKLAREYMDTVLMSIPENQKKLVELKSIQKVA
ncbi:conserved hypothetical protein [Tenacibaculum litopenaei]|uniref:hypothetical protein n=1 Tax=Tenacibaculum litopenaei TaxID=396016 RepID=UPI003893F738